MGSAPSNHIQFDPYLPLQSPRLRLQQSDFHDPHAKQQTYNRSKTKIIHCGFHGIWSQYVPNCVCPAPRSGHFSCYSDDMHTLFIGYGTSYKKELLNDVWALDCVQKKWTQLNLSGEIVSPRTGACAFYNDNKIIVFGGVADSVYYSELHSIDLETGFVYHIQTTGLEPSPRMTPIFFKHDSKIFVWGGYNDQWPNELNVLDLKTMHWEQIQQTIPGRTAVPFIKYNNRIYSFGCCKNSNLLVIDPDKYTITEIPTYGSQPSFSTIGAGMTLVDHFALFFGGKAASEYALLYACDLEKATWFVFYVVPDNESVTQSDGMISELGMFLIPRKANYSLVYEPLTQEIIFTLGLPELAPPPLSIINISNALAHLHHRDDMCSILQFKNNRNSM